MKKLLFVLFAALAFVACEKENGEIAGSVSPTKITLTPNVFNAEAGTIIKIKTPVPTYNACYFDEGNKSYDTGVEKIPVVYPSTYENDYYSLVQTAKDTYEITVKSIEKACTFTIFFRDEPNNKGHWNLGYITVNYTPAE